MGLLHYAKGFHHRRPHCLQLARARITLHLSMQLFENLLYIRPITCLNRVKELTHLLREFDLRSGGESRCDFAAALTKLRHFGSDDFLRGSICSLGAPSVRTRFVARLPKSSR